MPGNEEQIPLYVYLSRWNCSSDIVDGSAFELYAELNTGARKSTVDMAVRFKETFARPNVKVHFLGIWFVCSLRDWTCSEHFP